MEMVKMAVSLQVHQGMGASFQHGLFGAYKSMGGFDGTTVPMLPSIP
jgi:hypothetical protein